jgi:hypothetical protein
MKSFGRRKIQIACLGQKESFFQKLADWLDWPCPVNPALKNSSHDFFFLFSLLIFIYFFKYEIIVSISPLSFGHSDPDQSSVL